MVLYFPNRKRYASQFPKEFHSYFTTQNAYRSIEDDNVVRYGFLNLFVFLSFSSTASAQCAVHSQRWEACRSLIPFVSSARDQAFLARWTGRSDAVSNGFPCTIILAHVWCGRAQVRPRTQLGGASYPLWCRPDERQKKALSQQTCHFPVRFVLLQPKPGWSKWIQVKEKWSAPKRSYKYGTLQRHFTTGTIDTTGIVPSNAKWSTQVKLNSSSERPFWK